ncbi:MAG: gas vesicle protein [Pseudomonadota bacterium]
MSGIGSPISHDSLADILERVLDKGVVIAGDVTVAIAGVELLSVKIRLLVTTVDKAMELGIDWWQRDPALSGAFADQTVDDGSVPDIRGSGSSMPRAPDAQIAALEKRIAQLEGTGR